MCWIFDKLPDKHIHNSVRTCTIPPFTSTHNNFGSVHQCVSLPRCVPPRASLANKRFDRGSTFFARLTYTDVLMEREETWRVRERTEGGRSSRGEDSSPHTHKFSREADLRACGPPQLGE